MAEQENTYNPQCRNLGLKWAGIVGRPNLAVSLGVDPDELDILLDTEVTWPDGMAEALLEFAERRERQKNGAVGVGPGETVYEFKHRAQMEAELAEAMAGMGAEPGEEPTAGERAAGVATGEAGKVGEPGSGDSPDADDEWALPGSSEIDKADPVVDPEMLAKAAHVLDLCALLDAGRRRLWDPEVSDKAWREISEAMCRLELVLIMDFSTDPGGSMDEWDRWRCQREADVRWNRLRELRRAMDQGWVHRAVRWVLGRKRQDWVAVLMRDVDRGGVRSGSPKTGEAAEWLGVSGMLERRWAETEPKGRRGRRRASGRRSG